MAVASTDDDPDALDAEKQGAGERPLGYDYWIVVKEDVA